ncbi:nitrilase-related carbon-nitrogen hydrolase [Nocardia sp. NPDC051832]|uniref:nitrilase-related carbon-nitrogen hydrolase n=1 Tax=Nocardia sp. NPDC051832 TaxID=3155673 RepID=UPI00341DD011
MSERVRVAAVQAEPRWLSLQEGIEQVTGLIAQASRIGAQLVAFPETFVPGYPWWMWLNTKGWGAEFTARYRDASMTREGEEIHAVLEAARAHRIHVVLGFSERAGDELFMSQALIDQHGMLRAVRRKPELNRLESQVFEPGGAHQPRAYDTALGRIGMLSGSEHLQAVARQQMYRTGEQIHIASWPGFAIYRGATRGRGHWANASASLLYSVESASFVIAPTAIVDVAGWELDGPSGPQTRLLHNPGGLTTIYGPDGHELGAAPSEKRSGLVYADLDFAALGKPRPAYPVNAQLNPEIYRGPAGNQVAARMVKRSF